MTVQNINESQEEVIEAPQEMRKVISSGHDEIPVKLLNDGKDEVGWHQRLVSVAWKEGKLFKEWEKHLLVPFTKRKTE